MDSNNDMTPDERRKLIDSIPVVSVVDSCKENIQPRKSGRSVAALTTLFDTNEREHQLQVGHTQFQEQLDTLDEEDDPLDVYIRYIAWTVQMYPQNNAESNLISLLADATDRFKSDRRYKHDPRYLKVWLEYARHAHEPREVFHYLINQEIGQTLSLFYEEYSAYYEKLRKYDKAIEVYELGISREADPIKRLKRNYTLLKSRLEERQQRGLMRRQQQEAQRQMQGLRETGQRTMLGERVDSLPDVSLPSNVYRGLGLGGGASPSSPLNRRATFGTFGNDRPAAAAAPSSPSSSFSVYVEPTPEPVRPFNSILPSSTSTPDDKLHISQNPLFKAENQGYRDNAGGSSPIPQQEISREVPVATYKVYRDPENDPKRLKRSLSTPRMLGESRTAAEPSRRSPIVSPRAAELSHHQNNPISGTASPARAEPSTSRAESLHNRNHPTVAAAELSPHQNNPTTAVESLPNRNHHTATAESSLHRSRSILAADSRVDPSRIRKNAPAGALNIPKKRPRRLLPSEMLLDVEALTPRYEKMKHLYHKTMDTQGYEDVLAVKWSDIEKQDMSIEEYRATTLKLPMGPPAKEEENEITIETRKAMDMVGSIFNEGADRYNADEQDLTWNNRVQRFNYKKADPVNENAYNE